MIHHSKLPIVAVLLSLLIPADALVAETNPALTTAIQLRSPITDPARKKVRAALIPRGATEVPCAIAHYTPAEQVIAVAPAREPIKQGTLITVLALDGSDRVLNELRIAAPTDVTGPTEYSRAEPAWWDCLASVPRR